MKIKFRIYEKKDGSLMIYANGSNGCSVGIAEHFPAKYGKFKLTNGQIKILDAIDSEKMKNYDSIVVDANFDAGKHAEKMFDNALGKIFITDTANVAGVATGSDGAFVLIDNCLVNLSQEFDFNN